MRVALGQTVRDEQARQKTRTATLTLEGAAKTGLKPWREVVTPHRDVAAGRFAQAEFAADLAQVARGEGGDEYRDPVEFYRRTFLTDGLRRLLTDAMRRLAGQGGNPVVELQTNFGGGKTHSMLALWHLAGPQEPRGLPGVEGLMAACGVHELPRPLHRAALVGTALSAAETVTKPDGTVLRTLWGELAWQLGGREGYGLVAKSDEQGVNPGSALLKDLLDYYAPAVVLIDEWVVLSDNHLGRSAATILAGGEGLIRSRA
jgi:predicted AAA+ superfamily ATPase